jgi:hypothetical protein
MKGRNREPPIFGFLTRCISLCAEIRSAKSLIRKLRRKHPHVLHQFTRNALTSSPHHFFFFVFSVIKGEISAG